MVKQRVIVVVGMHRSGTSALARGLEVLGVSLGERLIPPSSDNPKGYFEDWDITELNKEILHVLGLRWDSVSLFPDHCWDGREIQALRLKAVEIIRRRFGELPLWGFKDPRTSRLLRFWQPVFRHLDLDDRYVIAYRNPLSVVRSLAARDRFAAEKSYLLWLEHNLDVLRDTRGKPRVVVDYDSLLHATEEQLRRVCHFLGLEFPKEPSALTQYVAEFLDPGLRHAAFSPEDAALDPALSELGRRCHELLRSMAAQDAALDMDRHEEVTQLESLLQATSPFYSYLDTIIIGKGQADLRNQALEQQLAELVRDLENTRVSMTRMGEELSQLRQALHEATTELNAERARHADEVATLRQSLIERDTQIAFFLAERATFGAQVGRAITRLRGRIAPVGTARGNLATAFVKGIRYLAKKSPRHDIDRFAGSRPDRVPPERSPKRHASGRWLRASAKWPSYSGSLPVRLRLIAATRSHYRRWLSRTRPGRALRNFVFRCGLMRDQDMRLIDMDESLRLKNGLAAAHLREEAERASPADPAEAWPERRRSAPEEPYTPPRGLLPWFNPLNVATDPTLAQHPRLNVLIPSLQLRHLSGGPNTAIVLAMLLAQQGVAIRLIATDTKLDDNLDPLWQHIQTLAELKQRPANVEIVDAADRSSPLRIGRNDLFLATAWWTAQMAKYARQCTRHRRFVYLIQDYEPLLHPASSAYALARETYDLDFIPVVNTSLLLEYLCENKIGRFSDPGFCANALVFEPAVNRSLFFATPKTDSAVSRKKTLLFYARPTNGLRNLFEIGVAALQKVIAEGVLPPESWKICGIGESFQPFELGRGVKLEPLPWYRLEDYAATIREADILLSLMLSPHPSYPPLEMAACGNLVVTNCFGTKTAERLSTISPNIIVAEPTIESIADAISKAVKRMASRDVSPQMNLPGTWRESLSSTAALLSSIVDFELRQVIPDPDHSGEMNEAELSYERFRQTRLAHRRYELSTGQIPGLFSFVTTVWNTPPAFLNDLSVSVFHQDGGTGFEWIILDNGSTREDTVQCIQKIGQHPCVKLYRVEENLGIVGGLRFCLEKASGRYILPLDSDDFLYPDCVRVITEAVLSNDYPKLLYTDEDKFLNGRFRDPYFKPDWDPVLFLDSCYIAHLCVIDRETALKLGVYSDARAEGSHDGDTFLRFMLAGYTPRHISEVLYTWRMHEQSTASHIHSKPYVYESQRFVLSRFLDSLAEPSRFQIVPSPLFSGTPDWWIKRKPVEPRRMLSLVFAIDGENMADSPQETDPGHSWHMVRHVSFLKNANGLFDAVRNVASDVEFIHLQWNQVEPQDQNWYWECIGLFELFPDTAMVGGAIHDGQRVLSGALTFGYGRGCDCPDRGRLLDDPGYFAQMWKHRSASAVSAAHCVVERQFFENAIRHLTGRQVTAPFLGPWLGALARRFGKRVVFSPFMPAKSASALEDFAGPSEVATFRTTFSDLIPESRYLSPHLGLSPQSAYLPVTGIQRDAELRLQKSFMPDYETWLREEINVRRDRYPVHPRAPDLCVITTIYGGTEPRYFEQLVNSLYSQTVLPHAWIIVADSPLSTKLDELLRTAEKNPGTRVIREPGQKGIAAKLRKALQYSYGDYILPVDADDVLTEDALQIVGHELARLEFPEFAYSDEDILVDDTPSFPYLRPDADPVLCLESSYVWHLTAIRRDAALRLELYSDEGATWAHDWDTMLRIMDAGARIVHIPEVVYHWRRHKGSTSNRPVVSSESLDSVRHILESRITRLPRPELFEVAPFPIDRGVSELYIRRRRTDPPKSAIAVFGNGNGNTEREELRNWARATGNIEVASIEQAHMLLRVLETHPDFVFFAHRGITVDWESVYWEAVRLFDLHAELSAIGGIITDRAGVVIDGCYIWNHHGALVSPWLYAKSDDPGPYALSLKPHRVVKPSILLAAFRSDILYKLLADTDSGMTSLTLLALLGNRLAAQDNLVAFSPLIRGVQHEELNLSEASTNMNCNAAGVGVPRRGLAGFLMAETLFGQGRSS